VLRGKEDPLSEAAHERAWRDQTGDRSHREARDVLQHATDIGELRDAIGVEPQAWPAREEFGDRIARVNRPNTREDVTPYFVLFVRVRDDRDRIARTIAVRELGDGVAAAPVRLIAKARVVAIELHQIERRRGGRH